MTTYNQKRRAQVVCALLLHVPLVAIAAYALARGEFGGSLGLMGVALVSTVAATLMIVPYIGRVLDGGAVAAE